MAFLGAGLTSKRKKTIALHVPEISLSFRSFTYYNVASKLPAPLQIVRPPQ